MIKVELDGFDEALELFKSMPERTSRAAANAINDALKEVQVTTFSEWLPHAFTLRGRGTQWWQAGQKFGFNIKPYATPEELEGTLGSQADWLKLQEFGGTKAIAGHNLAIPVTGYKPKDQIMARRLKPRQLLDRKNSGAFKATMPSGLHGIFMRTGDKRLPIKLLFNLDPSAHVPKRLSFEEDGQKMAEQRYQELFANQFLRSLANTL